MSVWSAFTGFYPGIKPEAVWTWKPMCSAVIWNRSWTALTGGFGKCPGDSLNFGCISWKERERERIEDWI